MHPITEAREAQGWSRAELARRAKLNAGTVSQIEAGRLLPYPGQLAKLARALNMMSVGGFRHIPVTDAEGRAAFIISIRDIVEFLVESFPSEILNLPPDFGRQSATERDGA